MSSISTLLWIVGGGIALAGLWSTLRRSERPGRLALKWLVSAVVVIGLVYLFRRFFRPTGGFLGGIAPAFILACGTAVCAVILAALWTPNIVNWLTSPLLRLFYDDTQQVEPEPHYSIAEAHRKKGRYADAIAAIQQELARFPDDLRGILMLAEIQAVDLNDLETAESTLEEYIASQTGTSAHEVAILNQMADWRLSLAKDLDGARMMLERIRTRFPESEAAFMAAQRLAHFTNPDVVAERHAPKAIPYVEFPLPSRVGEVVVSRPEETSPGQEAAELVKHLERYPEDVEARERLAILYGEHYHRLDMARSELEQLISGKHAPPRKKAAWLNRLADLEIQVAGDGAAARAALERIIRMGSNTAAAEQARRRIMLLERELKVRRTT